MAEPVKHKVLIVDDEPEILKALTRGLHKEPYEKIFVESGSKALEIFVEHDISVLITDMRMPGMTGLELLEMVEDISPDTVKIVLTGYTKLPQILATINRVKVYKFLTKPWNLDDELKVFIRTAIDMYEENLNVKSLLKGDNQKQSVYQRMITDGYEKVDHFMTLYSKLVKVINYHHLISVEEFRAAKDSLILEDLQERLDISLKHLSFRMNFINRVFDISKFAFKQFSVSDLKNMIERQISYSAEVTLEAENQVIVYHDNLKQIMGVMTEITDFPRLNDIKILGIKLKEIQTDTSNQIIFHLVSNYTPQMLKSVEENRQFITMVIKSIDGMIDFNVRDEAFHTTVTFKMRLQK